MPAHTRSSKSLVQFVEEIDNAIHQNPDDEEVAAIIKENFSPDLSVLENETVIDFAGFKKFNTDFRKGFISLQILDSKAVTFKADPQGLVGVVGFAQSFLFERKSDGQLSTGDTIEIFEVDFAPRNGHTSGKKRVITKAFAAFGDMNPISNPISMARTPMARGRVRKTSSRSHPAEARNARPTASKAITKKHRVAKA